MLQPDLARRIVAAIDPDSVLGYAQPLLRIPSFCGQEQAVAEHLAERMEALGLQASLPEVEPGRPNAIGVLRGRGGGQTLVLNGHMDHNMVCEGWTRDPFSAEVDDGWLYALGVANMKAGDAAYLAAIDGLQKADVTLDGDVVVEYVVGELEGGKGTRHAIQSGITGDAFIDAEPTELWVVNMHAGVVVLKLHVRGEMRHYTTRTGMVNHAIQNMLEILRRLGPTYTPIPTGSWLTYEPHPDYEGLPQYNVGVIRGGITEEYLEWRPALVPDRCTATLDVRIVPSQSPQSVVADLEALIDRVRRDIPGLHATVELQDPAKHVFMPPFLVPREAPVIQATAEAHRLATGQEPEFGGPTKYAGADSGHLHNAGIPGLLYGPGGKYLSRPDERVEVKDIVTAARVYALVAADLCNRPKA